MKPNFLIPGASRSGTTSLYNYLKDHPEIFMPGNKEVRYFDRDDRYGDEGWYLKHFREASDEEAVGESSPPYFYDKIIRDQNGNYQGEVQGSIVSRIKQFNPEMKILISLRNPVDRAYSQYWKNRNNQNVDDNKSFRQVIDEEISGKRTPEDIGACWLYKNMYPVHLKPWLENFPDDQVKIIIFEEWIQDPKDTLQEICGFLGVESNHDFSEVLGEEKNSSRIYRSKVLKYFYRKNPLLKYVYRNHVLDNRLEDFLKKITHQSGYPNMSDETRRFVYEQLEDDIGETEELLGRDLDVWKY